LKGSNIEFGIQLPTFGFVRADFMPFKFVLDLAMTAEKLGYHSVWVPDHLFLPEDRILAYASWGDTSKLDMLEAWTLLSSLAAKTQKVKVGTCVTPIPLRHPGILAKMAATIDMVSHGRLILGVGLGWCKEEFEAYGISWDRFSIRHKKMTEGIKVIKKLWTEDGPVTHRGKHYKLKEAPFWPKPLQKPHPPIWIGGASKAVLESVAEVGDGWIPGFIEPESFEKGLTKIRTLAKELGRERDVTPAIQLLTSIAPDHETARHLASPLLARKDIFPTMEDVEKRCVVGTPDDCTAKIERYIKAGARCIVLQFTFPRKAKEGLKLYSEKVIPHFKNDVFG